MNVWIVLSDDDDYDSSEIVGVYTSDDAAEAVADWRRLREQLCGNERHVHVERFTVDVMTPWQAWPVPFPRNARICPNCCGRGCSDCQFVGFFVPTPAPMVISDQSFGREAYRVLKPGHSDW